jgi:(1->4)-alpha-D-glucan 1-alpha-D-glucosylmutase
VTSTAGRYGTPRATYRLQLHRGFDFDAAASVVPYLSRLGISHVYLSPIFAAMPGSTHGYDVTNYNVVNAELGGAAGLYRLHDALVSEAMGCVVDIVPNHMGVGVQNPWWFDVLRYGRESRFAAYFDIDWDAVAGLSSGRLFLPELQRPLAETLEAGELRLALADGLPEVQYGRTSWPLAPVSISAIFSAARSRSRAHPEPDRGMLAEALALVEELRESTVENADAVIHRLAALTRTVPKIARALDQQLQALNRRPRGSGSFDSLEAILRAQHYVLAGRDEFIGRLSYRRFFDVNGLAALCVERNEVFRDVHALLFDLVESGVITGVRVDHIDGLYDPAEYLRRLRTGLDSASARHGQVPVYVEKVLAGDEQLSPDWQTEGTTGYEFAARVGALLVDDAAGVALASVYSSFTRSHASFEEVSRASRELEATQAFVPEIDRLAVQLQRLAHHAGIQDHTLEALRVAIRAVLVAFPVYRTYVPDHERGNRIREAVATARRRLSLAAHPALKFVEDVLLVPDDVSEGAYQRSLQFRRRFEQVSGPVMAKGVEDTAFYRYNILLSLNEVGGSPGTFGRSVAELHRWLAVRLEQAPQAMLGASTHDTKRSEDVRTRLAVLSEMPTEWAREILAWSKLNRRHRSGPAVPGLEIEYYLYQTLVGSAVPGRIDEEYRGRIAAHIIKASREAKLHTNWTSPDAAYESACVAFVDRMLSDEDTGGFVQRLEGFLRSLIPAGCVNALAALVVRCLSPGFPDFYQGTEIQFLALTDPDNRRKVDFEARKSLLVRMQDDVPGDLCSDDAKMWLTRRLLAIRRSHAETLENAGYAAIATPATPHVFAFARSGNGRSIVAVVPRLVARLVDSQGRVSANEWGDVMVTLPDGPGWRDALTGSHWIGSELRLRDLLQDLPFAVLVSDGA